MSNTSRKSIEITREGREYLREKIPFKVYPSQANFVLVDVAPLKAKAVTENLHEERNNRALL